MLLNLKNTAVGEQDDKEAAGFSCELDLSAVKLWGERPFPLPVRVLGNVVRLHGAYTVSYGADFITRTVCSRCLAPVEREYHKEFTHVVLEEDRDGGEIILAPNAELDLHELVTSDLLFETCEVPLCGEDCRGICPKCGKNLNNGGCGCDLRVPDTRFDALRKLIEE